MGINWNHTGADPGGSLQYQVGCGTPTPGGTPVCLVGVGPHTMTICKPGGNISTYYITALPKPKLPDSIHVRSGCTQTLSVSGFSVPTIRWNAVNSSSAVANYSAAYNGYLSCVSGCSLTVVTPTATPPAWIDYEVSGYGQAPCISDFYRDTVRVFFFSDLFVGVNTATICAGQTNAVLTATASGGKPPLTYSWSTGATTSVVTVGAGTYTVLVRDGTGCPPVDSVVTVTNFTLPITVTGGNDQNLCKNNPAASLNRTVTAASGASWTTSGSGSFAPTATNNPTTYNPSAGDLSAGSVQLFVRTTGNSGCQPDQDTVIIFYQNAPTVTAVSSATVCANNAVTTLTGAITGYAPAGPSWSTSSGTISAPGSLSTQFTAGPGAITAGSVNVVLTSTNNGVCPAASATSVVYITPSPSVNAGPDNTICSNSSANLSGSITLGATSGSWTTTGSGTFSNANALATSYTPGASDISTGTVSLILKSVNHGNCLQVSDTLKLTLAPMPTVSVTNPTVICSTANSVALSGTITGATTTGTWNSSGSGNFPTNNSSGAIYNLSQADRLLAQIIFTLTSTNNTICPAAINTVTLSITPIAFVNAGANAVVCASQNTIQLNGTAITASWSASGTGTFNNVSTPVSSYAFSAADIAAGVILFTITSTGNGVCPPVTDTVAMRIRPLAIVNAGNNTAVCASTSGIPLAGSVSGGTNSGTWSASGGGSFSSVNSLTTSYTPSQADFTAGSVIFTLTSSSNSPCASASDTVKILIQQLPVAAAGSNFTICSTNNPVTVTGSVSGSPGTGSWTTSGSGTFPNGNNSVSATYQMSSADMIAGIVIFTLTSTNNGPCAAANSTLSMGIVRQATVIAAPPQSICANNLLVPVSGTVVGGSGSVIWTSSGTGSFTPGNTFLNSNYQLSSADVVNGKIVLTLASTNDAPCVAHNDTMGVRISVPAQVNTGTYAPVCSSTGTLALNGSISGGSQAIAWSSSGTGTFLPSSQNLTAGYKYSQSDISNGSIVLTITSLSNGACPADSKTTSVIIRQQPSVTAVPDVSVCSTSPYINLGGTLGGLSQTAIWSSSGSGTFTPNNVTINTSYSISANDINNGLVTLIITTTNNDVCPAAKDSVNLTIVKFPVIQLKADTTICSQERRMAMVPQITNGSGNFRWLTTGNGSFEPDNFSIPSTYILSDEDTKRTSLVLTLNSINNGACGTVSSNFTININPTPEADFTASTFTVNLPSEPVKFTNMTVGGAGYRWEFGDGTFTTAANPSKQYTEVGFYTVTLTARNEYNCSDTVAKQIVVIKEVLVPTAFTPNGDRLNSTFRLVTDGVTEYDLMIFNRWGEMIFRTVDLNSGWDGTFNGKPCQQDAYVWKAKIKFFDGRTFDKTGSITLLR
jgi:gliding motility-associated-like protein